MPSSRLWSETAVSSFSKEGSKENSVQFAVFVSLKNLLFKMWSDFFQNFHDHTSLKILDLSVL